MTMKTNTRLMLRPVTSRGQRQFLIRVNDRPALLDCALLTEKQLLQEQRLHRQLQQEERQHDHPALHDCSLGDNDED